MININKPELINFCEFDPYATKSYCVIHNVNESLNLGDITKVKEKEIADFNMMVGGSPCQDFSVAGKQKGAVWTCKDCGYQYNPLEAHFTEREKCPKCHGEHIEKTRSSLLVEWLRILKAKKPNFAMYENVKNIVGKQFKPTFELFEKELDEYGYNTYWKILNAKDYGIPQSRERVYLIIIKKELDNGKFNFPQMLNRAVKLIDVLEQDVEKSFYISKEAVPRLVTSDNNKSTLMFDSCQIKREGKAREYNDYSPTLAARDYKDPRIINDCVVRHEQNITDENFSIRKATPKEYFRLMGFDDEDFYRAKRIGISNSQLYKQSGNSIVVNVLFYILVELYNAMPYLFDDIKISSFFSGIGAFEKALDRLYTYINSMESKNVTKS